MDRMIALVLASGMAFLPPRVSVAQAEKLSGPQASMEADIPANGMGTLPPLPAGTSTIFGGAIRKIDPVRDQIQLSVYGDRPMKIYFDERTQVFRDGVKIPLHDLKPTEHASVQTTLDGTNVFAVSIHILSKLPQGEYRGRIVSFNRSSGELRLQAAPSPEPIKIQVPNSVKIERTGQSSFTAGGSGSADLVPGALVDVNFGIGGGSDGVATHVVVLATPGSTFVFSGTITALDLGAGSLSVLDPRDQNTYRILFEPSRFAISPNLRVGQQVRITARYGNGDFLASSLATY